MFKVKRKINFYDCDPAGIIFFSKIFDHCHSAYEELINSLLLSYDYWNNDDFVVPIIHTEADYKSPLKPGNEITINVKVSLLKNSSFELSYECMFNDKISVSVKTVHVVLNKVGWSKVEMEKDLKMGLMKYNV